MTESPRSVTYLAPRTPPVNRPSGVRTGFRSFSVDTHFARPAEVTSLWDYTTTHTFLPQFTGSVAGLLTSAVSPPSLDAPEPEAVRVGAGPRYVYSANLRSPSVDTYIERSS